MFSRGETRISLSLSLSVSRERKQRDKECVDKQWLVGRENDSAYNLARVSLFVENNRERERRYAGKIDTLPAIVCQQRERKKKRKSFLLFLRRGKRLLFLLSLPPSISFLWITRPVGVQSVTDCSPVEKGEREDRQGGDELHLD